MSASSARARALPRLRDEAGFSVAEMVVALGVGLVLLSVVLMIVEFGLTSFARVDARVDATQRGRTAMEELTSVLRSQVCLGIGVAPVVQADDQSVTFHADLGDTTFAPMRVRFAYDPGAGTIVEERYVGSGTPPAMTYPASPTSRRLLLEHVVPLDGRPVFRYFTYDLAPTGQADVELPVPLSATDRERVVRIAVAFAVDPRQTSQSARARSSFENEVTVRTADPNGKREGAECL